MAGGVDAVQDYELLELVLFRAVPRRDVKPLAKTLIDRFGGFAEAISAEPALLRETSGVGDAIVTEFAIVRAAAVKLAQTRVLGRESITNWKELLDYCRAKLADETRERFHVLFLDRKNRLIADEEQQKGTVDQAAVYPREVVKRALDLNASAMILVHNHPSGDPTPSRADIEITRDIAAAAKPLGLNVHDHLIIGRDGHASFRSLGLL